VSREERTLPPSRVLLFAVACGLAVANVYYAHPLLDAIADSFGIAPASIGIVVTVTQIGYGVGLLLLVPLGDVLDRRRLIVTQLLMSVAALALVGAAWSPALLLVGMAAVGLLAVVAQVLVAYAATLAQPEERGRVVGAVTSGIVVGILLARTFAGLVTELAGWRSVYLASAALTLVLIVALLHGLPADDRRASRLGYRALLGSTFALYLSAPALRIRGTLAMLIFAGFSVLWASLALELSDPPLSLSHGAIGVFGLAGAAGALAAVRAGRLADRGHGQRTTAVALTLMLVAWLPLAFLEQSLLALVAGLLLLDFAVQAVHVTNQSIVYAVDPDARSRLAGGYMVFYSIGSAAGSIASTATYAWAGWPGVCVLGAAISAAALGFWAATVPRAGRAELPDGDAARHAVAALRPAGDPGAGRCV
jgi:predicted MFS family arabinose efflux permease